MTILLSRIAPCEQLLALHGPLTEFNWLGMVEHRNGTLPAGVRVLFAPVPAGKSLLARVEERGKFPGIRRKWCTAEHKCGPIERELRRFLKVHPRFGGPLVNWLGIGRDESATRASRVPWRHNERMSVAGREVLDWLPVIGLSTDDIFLVIRNAGQSPHWAYAASMSKLSGAFAS